MSERKNEWTRVSSIKRHQSSVFVSISIIHEQNMKLPLFSPPPVAQEAAAEFLFHEIKTRFNPHLLLLFIIVFVICVCASDSTAHFSALQLCLHCNHYRRTRKGRRKKNYVSRHNHNLCALTFFWAHARTFIHWESSRRRIYFAFRWCGACNVNVFVYCVRNGNWKWCNYCYEKRESSFFFFMHFQEKCARLSAMRTTTVAAAVISSELCTQYTPVFCSFIQFASQIVFIAHVDLAWTWILYACNS